MTTRIGRRTALLTAAIGLTGTGIGTTTRAQGADPVVETASGRLRGSSSGGVQSFKGIPYAASTAGTARFLPPSPPAPWPGIRDGHGIRGIRTAAPGKR